MKYLRALRHALGASWRFIRRDKKALAGSIILFVLLVIALFPSWFTPEVRPARLALRAACVDVCAAVAHRRPCSCDG